MPYSRNSELPPGVKGALPAAAQTIYRKAHNAAGGDEATKARIAWAVVGNTYHKVGGNWIAKEAMSASDWKAAYRKGTPHWADDLSPSLFAQEFVGEMKKAKAKTVLEVGSGNGRDSIFFARAGFKATAVDIAPEAVDMTVTNARDADVTIDARVANAEALPFEDNSFDAFFSLSVMHSTKLGKSLPEVARVLASDGLAFIYLYGNTVTAKGKTTDVIKLDDYIKLLHEHGFILQDFYAEQEDEFDDAGEKHRLFVTLLQNG